MDPITAVGAVIGLARAGAAVSREVRAWLDGRRSRVQLALDHSGQARPLGHDNGAMVVPYVAVPASESLALLHTAFKLADNVAARRLSQDDPTLFLVWDALGSPEFDSVILTGGLGDIYELELVGGIYNVAACVLYMGRDEVLGTAEAGNLTLPWSTRTELLLPVSASETEHLSDLLIAEFGDNLAELILPDGLRLPLGGETLIGRGDGCLLQLPDPAVSVQHAVIRFVDGGYLIEDLGTTNGTFVNGIAVARCFLQHGDTITLASWYLEFRLR